MDFFILGVSHHRAPVEVRERFSGREGLERRLYQLQAEDGVLDESLVLSTCNRLEILAVSENQPAGRRAVLDSLASVSDLPVEKILPYLHEFNNMEAARHLFRVAASLDSLVLGEPQILGQVKAAFRQALDHHRAGRLINKLMHRVFRTAKRVRGETTLGGGTVSVAGAAVALARKLSGGDMSGKKVLVLGAGPMAALALANLRKRSRAELTVMNRSSGRAEILAAKHEVRSLPWLELERALAQADLVIAATGARRPFLNSALFEKIMPVRQGRPLYIVDIGVPRNASHDLKRLEGLVLRNIDDLNEVVWESRLSRQEASLNAEAIIEEELAKFGQWFEAQVSQPTVSALTRKAESIRRAELERTLRQHQFSPQQAASLELMTAALVRRLLHDPLAFIKNSAMIEEDCWPEGACPGQSRACQPRRHCLESIRRAFNIAGEGKAGD